MYILDGRESFYQWDSGQKVTDRALKVGEEVHFYNIKLPTALVVIAYELDGKVVANVPNILLQSSQPITAYRYITNNDESSTIAVSQFEVKQRPKPDDYLFSETEVLNYASLDKRITLLENGSGGGGSGGSGEDGFSPIAKVEQTENGAIITITDKKGTTNATVKDGKDGTVVSVTKNNVDMPRKGTAVNIETIDPSTNAVDYINFIVYDGIDGKDGKDGTNGSDGQDGYTPTRGTDYWTPEDIAEIKSYVDEAILGGAW